MISNMVCVLAMCVIVSFSAGFGLALLDNKFSKKKVKKYVRRELIDL